jgi:serine/threonine protein phosphatase PrpC
MPEPTPNTPWMEIAADDERPRSIALPGLGRCVCMSRAAPAKRRANEDALAVIPLPDHGIVIAVADGAGGMPHADAAARIAVESLEHALRHPVESVEEAVLSGFKSAHDAIGALRLGAASTLIAAWITATDIVLFNAGDSQAVIAGGRGKPKFVSVAHSPVGVAQASGELGEDEALVHPERHIVANMLGVGEVRVEWTRKRVLALRDTVLLASDGVFDNLRIGEICSLIHRTDLEAAGSALLAACDARMREPRPGQPSKPDDLTFVLFRRSSSDAG